MWCYNESINKNKGGLTIKIIAILNLKGGIGKSTTAKNMAYILGKDYGKRVLLGDMDSSGNLSAAMYRGDSSPESPVVCKSENPYDDYGMSHLLKDRGCEPHDYIIKTSFENVSIIPSNDTLQETDSLIRIDTAVPQQYRLSRQLRKVQNEYDYCILDCPPAFDMIVTNALYCAHEVIIPSSINKDSIDAIDRVARFIDEISEFNPSLMLRGVLFTRIAGNNSLDKNGLMQMKEVLPYPVFNTYIRNSIVVENSRFLNMSIREYDKKSNPAIDYDNFVAEYLGKPLPHEPANTNMSNGEE